MGDKETLGERVETLLVNPDVIQRVELSADNGEVIHGFSNARDTQKSLQIFAYITDNQSMLTPEGAKNGLEIYGEELREDARENPGKHANIDFLERVALQGVSLHSHIVTPYSAKPIPEHVRKAMPTIAEMFGTPMHIYDEDGIRATCRDFNSAFSWNRGFRNYDAVKAAPNPRLLEVEREEASGADCSSSPELTLSHAAGMRGEDIISTSNDTPDSEFQYARRLGAIENLDDITFIAALERATGGLPELICFRYTGEVNNSIIVNAEERKYGLTKEQIFMAYEIVKDKGVKRFGLHTMMASNERDVKKLLRQAEIMTGLGAELSERGIPLEFINLGGGVGTSYKPWDRDPSIKAYGEGVKALVQRDLIPRGLNPRIFLECGRAITGPHGWLLTRVRHVMKKLRDYVGVDASMADLMRPGMYGAYHHLTVLGKEQAEHNRVYDVVGSLCENNDKFAVQRFLPELVRGDLLATHNSGAHGRAMGFNYNGKLRSGEVLVRSNGDIELIRRAETEKDYFATFDFPGSKYAHLAR